MNSRVLVGLWIGAINMLLSEMPQQVDGDQLDIPINIIVEAVILGKKVTMYCYDISVHADEFVTLVCNGVDDVEFEDFIHEPDILINDSPRIQDLDRISISKRGHIYFSGSIINDCGVDNPKFVDISWDEGKRLLGFTFKESSKTGYALPHTRSISISGKLNQLGISIPKQQTDLKYTKTGNTFIVSM